MLFGAAALAVLGATSAACGSPPPPEMDDLITQLDRARSDSQLATDAAAAAKRQIAPALNAVASERSDHARALADEIARITGEAATSAPKTTSPAPAPTTKDVIAALRTSADNAAQLAAQLSGYRAGLLGSIAASCTAAYKVALASPGRTQ
ncbi:MAG: hypothetical protein ACRDU5_23060 [Mycobacterium sp.]